MSGNGCGPQWLPKWVKNALFDWFFEASCDKHDAGYAEGGDEARRKHCDVLFLAAMRRDTLKQRGINRLARWAQAYAFYFLVRLFGWMQFNYKDKKGINNK